MREGTNSDLFNAADTAIRNAVTLAFQGDTDLVFDRLSAFALNHAVERALAYEIVSELWARAAAAIREEGPPPDPRWRVLMNPRHAPDYFFARQVALTERALMYLAGEHERTRLVEIALPGDEGGPLDPPMPVLLVGVPCATGEAHLHAVREQFPCGDAPPGLALFRHQYGGFPCMQYALIGYACAPPQELASVLEPFTSETCGEAFDDLTMRELSAAIERVVALGPIRCAHEALIEIAPILGASLRGRPVLCFEREDSLWNDNVWWASGEEPERAGVYSAEHDRVLAEIAVALSAAITVVIAWSNSD